MRVVPKFGSYRATQTWCGSGTALAENIRRGETYTVPRTEGGWKIAVTMTHDPEHHFTISVRNVAEETRRSTVCLPLDR
jgi:hypothetical protein